MHKKYRIMICDDSAVMRRLVSSTLSREPGFEVVYQAQHGRDAVDNVRRVRPDLLVLDVEMPVLDGIETVKQIRRIDPKLPIVMFSSLTTRGAEATLDALSAGADDFITKPSGVGHIDEAVKSVSLELIPRIHSILGAESTTPTRSRPPTPTQNARPSGGPISLVAIGVSTGGPQALQTVLSELPKSFSTPILIVQHMPETFTALLAERLDLNCSLQVREAQHNAVIKPGEVWIAKGGNHMEVAKSRSDLVLNLNQNPMENSVRPAVDPLFRSLARTLGSRVLGVIMTGMGRDGLDGCRHISGAGGTIVVQDKASSAVWGMPRAVSEAGLAQQVLPLREIASFISKRVGAPAGKGVGGSAKPLASTLIAKA